MKRSSNAKLFRACIVASLAVHAVIGAFVHARPVAVEAAEQPTIAQIIHLVHPVPTPRPTLKPAPAKHSTASAHSIRPRLHLIAAHARNKRSPIADAPAPQSFASPGAAPAGGDTGPSASPATAVPMPVATPKPACSAPDVPAKAVDPVTPEQPAVVADQGVTGTVKIEVRLDSSGAVVGTSVYRSSGVDALDRAALTAAAHSRYAPEEVDCKDVPGSYLFTVDFQ